MEKTDRFTREWFLHHKGDWVRNLSNIPEFDIGKLKYYLTENRNKTFDKEGMRAYKSLKAYEFFEEGYVQKISSLQIDNSPRSRRSDGFDGAESLQILRLP